LRNEQKAHKMNIEKGIKQRNFNTIDNATAKRPKTASSLNIVRKEEMMANYKA